MSKNVSEVLREWDKKVTQSRQATRNRTGGAWTQTGLPTECPQAKRLGIGLYLKEYQIRSYPPNPDQGWVIAEARLPDLPVEKAEREAMALCEVVRFEGDEAECSVSVSGYEMPRVSFPARVLRAHNLVVGNRFIWTMRNTPHICLADIDPYLGRAELDLSEADQQLLDELHEEAKRQRAADAGDWPEYTGSGQ